jgi:hypothetical protein
MPNSIILESPCRADQILVNVARSGAVDAQAKVALNRVFVTSGEGA